MSDFLNGKLENQEIYKRLLEYNYPSNFKPSVKLIDNIINQFWFHDFYNSFISDEFYLKYLIEYLDSCNPLFFNRYDFYKYIFDRIENNLEKRSMLWQIALEFEKEQSDALPPVDYNFLLEKVGDSAKYFDISWMENNKLGKVKEREERELFIWNHHTLTEFLVAEYLLEQEDFLRELQKLVVLEQGGITAFKPSWSGVLSFLMQSEKALELTTWLVGFLNKYPDNIDDNIAELIVYQSSVLPSRMKTKIFKLVYETYFNKNVWIPVWARKRLSILIDEKFYKRLKKDIKKWSNKTETFVRRGNIASIVEGLIENKSDFITKTEKVFWRTKFINFVNNPNDDGNGVLQRHGLGVLAQLKDQTIMPLVAQKCFEETTDTLVRDEFIELCITTAPNSKVAIDYFINGIKKGSDIYARHGLYKISNKDSLKYFLSKIANDEQFLIAFLKHESIFDKDGADRELLKNIEENISPSIIESLKMIIFSVLRSQGYYKEDQSNFLQQIVRIIGKNNPEYIFEIVNDIGTEQDEQKIDRLFYDAKPFLALLLTKDNLKKYIESIESFPNRSKRDSQYPIYVAKRLNGVTGELVYQEAVKLKLIDKLDEVDPQKYTADLQAKRKSDIYKSFLKQLEPKPGKYMTSIFKYYLDNRKDIEEQWNDNDSKRLVRLTVDEGIKKIDPRQFNVTIQSRHEGNSQFKWSSYASYYGDVLEIVNIIAPDEIVKHRQNIINFIPYEFGTGSILNFIKDIKENELKWVNSIMKDKNDDRRYLIPQTYIYLIGEYGKRGCKLPGVLPVLISFIDDPGIEIYNQKSALESLSHLIENSNSDIKKFLLKFFNESKSQDLAMIANGILVTVYREENAIDWRFNKLKEPLPFDGRQIDGKAHEVGSIENEFDTLTVAKPLIELRDEKYLHLFFELLEYSFNVLKEKQAQKYKDYVNYLWKTVTIYVENLKENGSFIPLLELEDWLTEHSDYENLNWLRAKTIEVKRSYINYVHPYDKLIDGVEGLSKLNIPAAQIAHFLFKAQIVEVELRKLIEGINYSLEKVNKKLPIYRRVTTETKDSIKSSTLGQLKNELNNYQGKSIEKLKTKLSLFDGKRNDFTHQLFLQNRKLLELGIESQTYSKHAEESLGLIQEVWKDILKVK